MAVNPVQFLVASSATVVNGDDYITITGNVDCSRVYSGTAIFLAGADNPVEGIRGSSPDGSGNSTITLRNPWSGSNLSGVSLIAFNTNEGLADAIINVREIVSNVSAIEDLAGAGILKKISDTEYQIVNSTSVGEALLTANDTATQRSLLGLGGSATLPSYSNYGLGQQTQQPNWPNSNIDNCNGVASGVYRTNGSITAPDPTAIVYFSRRNSGQLQQILISGYDSGNANTFQWRNSNGGSDSAPVWSDWKIVYHSGNSINPVDYGLGTDSTIDLVEFTDFNDLTEGGFYRNAYTSSVANAPYTGNETWCVSVLPAGGINVIQIAGGTTKKRYFMRTAAGNVWNEWNEIYHSGNSANPLDHGSIVKNKTLAAGHNLDTLIDNGTYTGFGQGSLSSSTGDNPFTGNGAFTITVSRETFGTDNYTLQTATWYANNLGIIQKQRVKSTNVSGWTDWYDVLNTSNTNFNTWNIGAGRVLSHKSIAVNTTSIDVELELHSWDLPAGITVDVGSCDIIDVETGTTVYSDVTPTLAPAAHRKLAILRFSVTGATTGKLYRIIARNTGFGFTITF